MTHIYQILTQNTTIRGRVILGETKLLRGEWAELHQILPEHLNTILMCGARFPAAVLDRLFLRVEEAIYIKFGENGFWLVTIIWCYDA